MKKGKKLKIWTTWFFISPFQEVKNKAVENIRFRISFRFLHFLSSQTEAALDASAVHASKCDPTLKTTSFHNPKLVYKLQKLATQFFFFNFTFIIKKIQKHPKNDV